jgi:hypothetical protein
MIYKVKKTTTGEHSIEEFMIRRPRLYEAAQKICSTHIDKILSAPVKSGKKEIIEICSKLSDKANRSVFHIVLSNYNRLNCKEQRGDLAEYGVPTYYAEQLPEGVRHINTLLAKKNTDHVFVHIDESDWGTAEKQKFGPIFHTVRKLNTEFEDMITFVFYSATNEEVIYSEFRDECELIEVLVPETYYGAKEFLRDNLVTEATPFWDSGMGELTEQGKKCCESLVKSKEHRFGVVRIPGKTDKIEAGNKGVFEKYLWDNYALETCWINSGTTASFSSFYWGRPNRFPKDGSPSWWKLVRGTDKKFVLMIKQIAGRSTEVGFHPLINFWHEYRGKSATYTTIHQSIMRTAHYKYEENKDFFSNSNVSIHIYGCKETIKLAAKNITVDDYVSSSGRGITRVDYIRLDTLSQDPEDFEITIHEYPKDLIRYAKEKYNENIRSWYVEIGTELHSVIRKKRQRWVEEEIKKDIFYGLSKGKPSIRAIAFYDKENCVHHRLIWHSGKIQQGSAPTTNYKSMFTNSK